MNADPLDNRPSPGLRRERLTGQVGLDELSDQLWIAVVESVRTGDRDGFNDLHEAVRVALSIDDVEDACRAYVGIVWCLLDEFRLDEAEPFMTDALELSEHAEFIGFLAYLQAAGPG